MRIIYLWLVVIVLLPALANAQSAFMALQPDRIFSGEMLYESGEWLLIKEGHVVDIISTEAELPPGTEKQQLKGKTMIPALIDATHTWGISL